MQVIQLLTSLISKRSLIARLIKGLSFFVVLIWILGILDSLVLQINPLAVYSELGGWLGIAAVLVYTLTLLPGIISRLSITAQPVVLLRALLTAHRRWLGILTFLLVLAHMSFSFSLPQLIFANFDVALIVITPFVIFGLLAYWIFVPLFLTSNDFSVTRMGAWWGRLHKLTYLALFFAAVHVTLAEFFPWGMIIGTVLLLEVWSWIRVWTRSQV